LETAGERTSPVQKETVPAAQAEQEMLPAAASVALPAGHCTQAVLLDRGW
jgi:hypothetical protein